MQRVDNPHSLCILIVSEDRKLTRELAQFLANSGYRTLVAADPQVAQRAVETGRPHVALIDARVAGRDHWALCRHLGDSGADGGLLKFLLIDTPDGSQLHEAMEAGIDDVFVFPLRYGEILARLRSAARLYEYDRRAAQQELLDAMTGLSSQSTLVAQLRRRWKSDDGKKPNLACVLIDLDFFAATRNLEGHGDTRMLLASVAEELHKVGSEADILACLGGDRFAAILLNKNEDAACEWAERIRQALANKTYADKPNCRITGSCGVASSQTADSVEDLLAQATAALKGAKESGRNCVVRWTECLDERESGSTWKHFFSNTVASDVLTPCTVHLQANESLADAARLFQQTRLEAVTVVDAAGKLVGLCTAEQVEEGSAEGGPPRQVRDVMAITVKRFNASEELSSLMGYFNAEPLAWAVVVQGVRPIGLLNCDSLLGLSQPASPIVHSGQPTFTDTTEFSLVPEIATDATIASE